MEIIQDRELRNGIESHQPVRKLKIEADGDSWKGLIKPKIRLMGRWLERAGFRPGNHVQVTYIAHGVIELHSLDSVMVNEPTQSSIESPECPF